MHHLALEENRGKENTPKVCWRRSESRRAGEQDTKEHQQCLGVKKEEKEKMGGAPLLPFLLLPLRSARVESLHVDPALLSEGALAVVDRDEACDCSHSYSTERGEGGACFPADSLNSVYSFHIHKVCSVVWRECRKKGYARVYICCMLFI